MTQQQADRATLVLAAMLAGLATLGPFSIDTYMPSFPAMERSLNASTLEIQQTLPAYLLPFACMMLFHGALTDSFGRRPVILTDCLSLPPRRSAARSRKLCRNSWCFARCRACVRAPAWWPGAR